MPFVYQSEYEGIFQDQTRHELIVHPEAPQQHHYFVP